MDQRKRVGVAGRGRHPIILGLGLLTALVTLSGDVARPAVGQAPDRRPIPDPPEQGAPWTAPETKLPRFLVSATEALFTQGVPDPRNCEYREVEPDPPTRWSQRGQSEPIHAFVLPPVAGDDRRFAVTWDGILTKVSEVGRAVDLAAEVQDQAEAVRKSREAGANNRNGGPGTRFWRVGRRVRNGGVETVSPMEICTLLRLGRADLAEQLFAAATPWNADGPRPDLTDYGISYLSLAVDWATGLYSRGVSAHGRGDDGQALDAFRRVASFRKQAEAKAAAMGFAPPQQNRLSEAERSLYFSNLSQLDDLLADQERRAAEPPRGPIPGRDANPAARVAALILNLDQIAEHQRSNPGGASPGSSPLVRDLIEMGDPAVEPLLKALVDDHRLTRSISYGRGFLSEGGRVSPTLDAILPALDGLMKASVPGVTSELRYHPTDANRRALADAYRKYWEANRAVPLAERYYKILADDSASSRWVEAANGLISPATDPSGRVRYVLPGQPPLPPLGEPLRGKREPSVTALMIRRAGELARRANDAYELQNACGIATALAQWDRPASLPVLHAMTDRARERFADERPSNASANRSLSQVIVRYTLIRSQAGDREALDEYAAWIRTTTPKSLDDAQVEAFRPMWTEPDHPSIAEASRALFADPKSPWVPRNGADRDVISSFRRILETSPLIRVPAFRDAVLAALADKSPAGTMTRQADHPDSVSYEVKGVLSSSFNSNNVADVDKFPIGEVRPIRACDWLAMRLAALDGTPRFEMVWPEPRRDGAITALAAFLRLYGDRYEAASNSAAANPFENSTHLAFPRLGRPATPADVAAGRAIFSLEGVGGEVRVVPLPDGPLLAAWKTVEDTPQVLQQTTPDGKSKIIHGFNRSGHVWQAEEVQIGDRWQRYFGFVGVHTLGRAPAEEINFPDWAYLGEPEPGAVGVRLSFVGPPGNPSNSFRPGVPLVAAVQLRNRNGVDQAVPTEFVRPGPDGKPALRQGIKLTLWRSDLPPEAGASRFSQRPPEEELKPSRDDRFAPDDATRTLGPAESFEAFRLELRDWFDLTRPGQYRLVMEFGADSGVDSSGAGQLYFRLED